MTSLRPGAAAVLVAALACAVYANSLEGGFVLDDHLIVEQNPLVHSGSVGEIARSLYWGELGTAGGGREWRPLTILSYRANHALFGLAPWSYHAWNLALHAGVSLLVLALALRLGLGTLAGLGAGALFAVHAVHTEAVASVVGRAELLATGAVLGGLWLHASGRGAWAAGVLLLGLLAKETALALPALALLWDALVERAPWRALARRRALVYAGYGLALALFFAGRYWTSGFVLPHTQPASLDNPLAWTGTLERLLTGTAVLGRYVGLLLFPLHLSYDYSLAAIPVLASPADAWFWLGAVSLAGGAAGTFFAWRRGRRALAFALAATLLTLLPISSLVIPIPTLMAERLLYLPSAGFCLAAGWLAGRLHDVAPRSVLAGLLLLIALHGLRAWDRNRDWYSDYTLFRAGLEVTPNSARVQNNFGIMMAQRGDLPRALFHFRKAQEIYPGLTDAYVNEAKVLVRLGRNAEAQRALDAAQAAARSHLERAAGREKDEGR